MQGLIESSTAGGAEHSPTDTRVYQQISALFALLDQEYHRKHHQEESQENPQL